MAGRHFEEPKIHPLRYKQVHSLTALTGGIQWPILSVNMADSFSGRGKFNQVLDRRMGEFANFKGIHYD